LLRIKFPIDFIKKGVSAKIYLIAMTYTERDSKVGNLARRPRKFFSWSERPLCEHKAQAKEENLQRSQRSQKPTFESRSVYTAVGLKI